MRGRPFTKVAPRGSPSLFGGGDTAAADTALLDLLLEPQAVVLPRPVEVDFTLAHGLECPLHADRADIDVGEHDGDEHHADHPVDHLGELHAGDVGCVEWEHEEIARHGCRAAAQHNYPVDDLLTGIEAAGRRVLLANQTPTFR